MDALLGWLLLGTWIVGVWGVINLVREMRTVLYKRRRSDRAGTHPH